jgi:hypothetical protein
MTYILDNLLPNELIKYEWKVHWFYTAVMISGLLFWFFILVSGWWIFGIAIMAPFLYQIIFILTTEIAVTNKRVLYKTWIIARDIFELQLDKIESAWLHQTIFQRLISSGTLVINGIGWNNKPIEYLSHPIDMKTIIYATIEKNN